MANDPQTFDELKVAVLSWSNRDDLDGNVEEFIALAERRLNRAIFVPDRESMATLTAAATVALPSDFWGVRSIWLDTDPKVVLDQMNFGMLQQAYAPAATGQPGNYAIHGSTLYLGPSPDSAYSVKLAYWAKVAALSVSNTTNWLLTAAPDIYIAASLVELYLYIVDEAQATLWEQRTAAKIAELNRDGSRRQYGGTPLRIRSPIVV